MQPKLGKEDLSAKYDALVKFGRTNVGIGYSRRELYTQFLTQAMNLVRRTCGEHSDHYFGLRQLAEDKVRSGHPDYLREALGIVEGARADFEAGLLFDLRSLLHAETLGEFTDQSQHLCDNGYFVPAASLAGAILEDALRKLYGREVGTPPEKGTIEFFNVALVRASVYNVLTQKQITAQAQIRNDADHGKPDKFKSEDVGDMIKWVRRFCEEYLR